MRNADIYLSGSMGQRDHANDTCVPSLSTTYQNVIRGLFDFFNEQLTVFDDKNVLMTLS